MNQAVTEDAKLKGTYFLNTVKALRRLGEEGKETLPEELRHYFSEQILTSSWYSERDHLGLLQALIRLTPGRLGDPWEHFGRVAGRRDMTSVYQALLKAGDPKSSFERLGSVWAMGHNTGRLEPKVLGEGSGQLELRDHFVAEEFCRVHGGFFASVLELAGGEEVEVRHPQCRGHGDPMCCWVATWKPPQ